VLPDLNGDYTSWCAVQIAMGFICPECKVKFDSHLQLGAHYSRVHEDEGGDNGGRPLAQLPLLQSLNPFSMCPGV